MIRLLALLLLASPALAGGLASPALADGPEVHDALATAAFPGAATGAAYMVIHNHEGPDDRLIGASSPAAEAVELHESTESDGVMRMEPVDALDLPAGGGIALAPGGLHLMLIGPTEAFADGATIPLTLTFETAGAVTVEVPVRIGPDAAGGAVGHDMDGMAPATGEGG